MTNRFWVAVAAAGMTLALSGGAQASTFDLNGGVTFFDGSGMSFDLVYDPLDRFNADATFSFFPVQGSSSTFNDKTADVQISQTGLLGIYPTFSLIISDPSFSYAFDNYDYMIGQTVHYSQTGYNFAAQVIYDPASNASYLNEVYQTPFSFGPSPDTSPITQGLIVATVPLPASLPMFGIALLALGGVAYARRRSVA